MISLPEAMQRIDEKLAQGATLHIESYPRPGKPDWWLVTLGNYMESGLSARSTHGGESQEEAICWLGWVLRETEAGRWAVS